MRVRMLTTAASADGIWRTGEVWDLPPQQALQLIAAGSATAVDAPETASVAPDEATVLPPVRRKKTTP